MLYDTSKENTEYEQSAFISFYQQILVFPLLIARLLLLSLSARTTVGPLSNQILMYYPKKEILLTLLWRKQSHQQAARGIFSWRTKTILQVIITKLPLYSHVLHTYGAPNFSSFATYLWGQLQQPAGPQRQGLPSEVELAKCPAPQVWCEKRIVVLEPSSGTAVLFSTSHFPKVFLTWWVIQVRAGSYLFALMLVSAKWFSSEANCQLFYSR